MPDRIIVLPMGHIAFVETKSTGDMERPQQKFRHQQLRRLGCRVFSTVDSYEKVDEVIRMGEGGDGIIKYEPHEYQLRLSAKIVDQPNIALFIGMGMGKTSITLDAINELMYRRFAVNRVLVIAPKKVAEATWRGGRDGEPSVLHGAWHRSSAKRPWQHQRTSMLRTGITRHGSWIGMAV